MRDGETKEESHVKSEAEIGVMLPYPRISNPQRLEETRKDSFLQNLEGVWPSTH